jgi:hypothetical protein
VVVQTGRGDLKEISANEKSNAFLVDDFVRFVADPKMRRDRLSEALTDAHNPLTTKDKHPESVRV